jgi:superfamily II DNA or RNA helicase
MIVDHIYNSLLFSIVSASNEELIRIRELLEFEEGSLLFEDSLFYFGLINYLRNNGIDIKLLNKEPSSNKYDLVVDRNCLNGKTLRDYQISSVKKAIHYNNGIFQIATGGGKTVIIAAIIFHYLKYKIIDSVICIVPTVHLLRQMYNEFVSFGFNEKDISRLGGGYNFENKPICISTSDSAYKELESIKDYNLLIVDEAHHTGSKTWSVVCRKVSTSFRFAFTATVKEDPRWYSYSDLSLIGLFGPIIQNIKSKQLIKREYLAQPIYSIVDIRSKNIHSYHWRVVYNTGVVENNARNLAICKLGNSCYLNKYKSLCFVAQKKHGHLLCKILANSFGVETLFNQGGSISYIYKVSGSVVKNYWNIDQISDYINENEGVFVVATQVFDEGIDIPAFNVVIMAGAMKKYRRLVQRSGRGMRPKEKDNFVYIFDFYDNQHVFLRNQSDLRISTYENEGYLYKTLDEVEKITGISW